MTYHQKGFDLKKILRYSALSLVFVAVAGYSLHTMRDYVFGVNLQIYGISDGQTLTEPKVSLRGNAKNLKALTVNDRMIGIAHDGTFKDNILLLPGYNIVSIKGDDKFGNTIEKNYHVFLKNISEHATALSSESMAIENGAEN